ncbi:hypothetical protein [Chryseobacterium sp.]|uniref:hypothetical protein n=1 Tax=Chryseobacterium sp. TaxID=1871047 RepID=UPI0028A2AF2E|nr:hypothetical protein [Chryseobacterium sp.]
MKISIAKEIIKDRKQIIDSLIYLSNEEYEELDLNLSSVFLFKIIDNYFQIVYANYLDFIQTIDNDSIELLEKSESPLLLDRFYMNKFKIESNRKFINYLSSFRTLIDHIPNIFTSEIKKDFQLFLNSLYDNEFSYRFMYKLRNYTQHCGLPITKYESKLDHSFIEIYLKMQAEHLLNSYDSWGVTVKTDLKKYHDIDSKSIIIEHFNQVRKIYSKTLFLLKDELLLKFNRIEKSIEKFKGDHKLLILLENDNGELDSITYIPLEEIEEFKKLFFTNCDYHLDINL